jgi:hypothetical protein
MATRSHPSSGRKPINLWLRSRIAVVTAHLAAWLETCADYYRAASLYEALSHLPDAELRRRGLSRCKLGRDLARACDRASIGDGACLQKRRGTR